MKDLGGRGYYASNSAISQLWSVRLDSIPSGASRATSCECGRSVISEVQAVCGPQVLPLFAEGIRQPRQAAHGHSDREVLALNVAGANEVRVRVAHDWDLLRMRDIGRAVPALAFGIGVRIALEELREIATVRQRSGDCGYIGLKAVCTDLEAVASDRMTQTFDENIGGRLASTAKGEIENQLRLAAGSGTVQAGQRGGV